MARKLRVLLVDDNPVTDLETQHLELLPVPYRGEEDPSLGSWAQHLSLWSENRYPETQPDLILVDCRFDADNVYVPMSDELKRQDPRGLLHGAIAVARMFGKSEFHPFGFSVYSMDAASFQNDAYAQTFMGFLLAMRDSSLPPDTRGTVRGLKARELVNACAQELGRTIRQNPSTAWSPALEMYRQRLKEVIDLHAFVVDRESWAAAISALRTKEWDAFEGGLALAWRRSDGKVEEVEFCSLFADLLERDRWTERAGLAADQWLNSLMVVGGYLDTALEWAHSVVEEMKSPTEVEPPPTGRDVLGRPLTAFFHACTATVGWLENRQGEEKQLSSGVLARSLGFDDQQLARYFKPAVGLSWGKTVAALDEGLEVGVWPFPGLWELRQVLHDWVVNIRGKTFPFRITGSR